MKFNYLNKNTFIYYTSSLLLLLSLLIGNKQNAFGQCPADPPGGTPNTFNSTMPDNKYFCEGVTSVILEPGISSPSVNFKWYKWNGITWDDLSKNGSNLQRVVGQEGKYAVCWQVLNTSVYNKDEIVLSTKNFSDQLIAENEFKLPTSPIFACSNQTVPTFPNAGNPLYKYSWSPTSKLSNPNIKNPTVTPSTDKGRPNTADFTYNLTIIDRENDCKVSNPILTKIYPILGPEFKLISAPLCQNKPSDLEVRVFMVPGYEIQSSTLTIGTNPVADPVKNYAGTAFLKEKANTLIPNNLGQGGVELKSPLDIIHVLRVPISYSNFGNNIPVKFTMVTDKGCTGTASTTIDVNPSPNYTVELDTANPTKSNFCINDAKMGPLKSTPAAAGTFSGPGVSGDATNGYFFTPKDAKSGSHSIVFTVTAALGVCAGGGSLPITVKPAPTPKLVGRANVCPGSFDIEYKDTAKVAAGVTKAWRIVNSNGTPAAGISAPTPFTTPPPTSSTLKDSVKVAFPNPYTETVKKAFIIAENDDVGCKASATIEVEVNDIKNSPKPIGPTTGCLGGSSTLQYVPGSVINPDFTYTWLVTNGTSTNVNLDGSLVKVVWDINALPGTRKISVRDVTTKQLGGPCYIQSEDLIVDFINPPIATIKNPPGQSVCAGDTVSVEELNPIAGVTYTWTPGNITGSSTKLIVPNPTAGFYSYSLKAELSGNTSCAASTDNETFTVKATPGDPLPEDLLENCFDDEPLFPITAVFSNVSPPPAPGAFAEWFQAKDVNNPDLNKNTWNASKSGIYSVKAIDGLTGCYKTGSVEIIDVCPAKFFVPAAFSPNGDFANDSLIIFGKRFITFDFKIFNRWGEVIFSTKDPSVKWDGTSGGVPVPVGVYPYAVVYESLNEKVKKVSTTKAGSITLIR